MRMQAMDVFTSKPPGLLMETHCPVSTFPNKQKSCKPFPDPVYPSFTGKWESHQAFTYSLFSTCTSREESNPDSSKQLTMKSSIL